MRSNGVRRYGNVDESFIGGCFVVVLVAIMLIGGFIWSWMAAETQADVYRREGIQITTFEVWMGAKPAERIIHLKDQK